MEITAKKESPEYCGNNGMMKFAGIHLIIELWKGKHFQNIHQIEQIMKDAITACGATMLSIDLHEFSPNG
ncbi:MAG: S-adenosylmethionine decarboxylase, partial [Planctomycetota bacterium]